MRTADHANHASSPLLQIYRAAVAAVHGGASVRKFLDARTAGGEVYAIAVGKAAAAMLEGVYTAWGERLRAALVVTKAGHAPLRVNDGTLTVIEAGHPLPDQASLDAGAALLDFIGRTPRHAMLLFLISGGASSLVEVPPPGVSLADLRRLNHWLQASGWDIARMNALRKRVSCIKGGRLASRLGGRTVLQLLISDVPGDAPADIGSGLLMPADTELATVGLPAWLRELLAKSPPLPPPDAAAFAAIETHVVANLARALEAAAHAARRMGYAVHLHGERLRGEAAREGWRVAENLIAGAVGIHLWGGETTVVLPPRPGRGGRNQHLALAAAMRLAGHGGVRVLAAGTDGSDGPGGDAGALIDGSTVERGELDGLDAADCLRQADAGTFLEASGDLVTTGPTGTNVTDLVIGLKEENAVP